MSRVKDLNFYLKRHDPDLFCQMDDNGKIHIYKKRGSATNDYVFSVTDDWTVRGQPRFWGIDPIINRIKAHDLAHNPDFFKDLYASQEKREESKKRARRNDIESFLYDFRSQFARAFNDVNTSTLEKGKVYGNRQS